MNPKGPVRGVVHELHELHESQDCLMTTLTETTNLAALRIGEPNSRGDSPTKLRHKFCFYKLLFVRFV